MMLVRLLFLFALCALALGNYYNQPKKCYVKKVSKKYFYGYVYGGGYSSGTQKAYRKYCRSLKFAHAKRGYCPNPKPNFGYYDKSCPDQSCDIHFSYATSRCHGKVELSKVFSYKAKECEYYPGKSCHQLNGRYKRRTGSYVGSNSFPHGSNSGSYGSDSFPHGSNSFPHGSNSGSYGSDSFPHGSNSGSYVPSSVPHGSTPGGYRPGYPKPIFSKCYCYTSKCLHKFVACYKYKDVYYQDTVKVQVPCGCSCYKGSKSWR
ncbi:uncharacterized protein LOC120339848 [Styela clava]